MSIDSALNTLKGFSGLAGGGGFSISPSSSASLRIEHNAPLTLVTGDGNALSQGTKQPTLPSANGIESILQSITPLVGIVIGGLVISKLGKK